MHAEHHSLTRGSRGFTLIEVVVALIVVSLGMLAVIETVGSTARNSSYLRDKTIAHWVAMNKLTEVRLLPNAPGIADPGGSRTDIFYGEKQRVFLEMVAGGLVRPYDDAVDLARCARDAGWRLAAASSSKNATRILRALGIAELFAADVCGRDVPRGKPAPDLFLLAAGELGAEPGNAWVVEDAVSGVRAAGSGGFLCVGIARCGDEKDLAAAGADIVTADLGSVNVEMLARRLGGS